MKLHDGTIVSRAEVSPHKFGGDPMAEFLWSLDMVSGQDEYTGDAIDWHYYVARYGKRLLFCNTQGFVWVDKYPTDREASEVFNQIESDYATWEEEG